MSVDTLYRSKCYAPAEALIKLLVELDNFEERRSRLEAKLSAGGEGDNKPKNKKQQQQALKAEWEAMKKERRRLERRKVDALNKYVFPSMANLTTFLELVTGSSHLNRVFDRDLRALFFAKSEVNKNKEAIFSRFIDACCWSMTVPKEGKAIKTPLPDFRLILMEIMMEKIWMMLKGIGEYKFKNVEFLNNVLYADFGRAVAWMMEFAHEPHGHLEFDEKRRPALF